MAVREEGCSQYLINTSPDATVKHINTLSPTVRVFFFFLSSHCVLNALCQPTGLLKSHHPSLQMWTLVSSFCLRHDSLDCTIVAIEPAILVVIAHQHFS